MKTHKNCKVLERLLSIILIIVFHSLPLFSQEICNNGIDDDGDLLIDLNDSLDCFCTSQFNLEIESMISNPSFEEYSCIPIGFSELSCANHWQSATLGTSDFYLNTINSNWN